jgi:hypothetical protein
MMNTTKTQTSYNGITVSMGTAVRMIVAAILLLTFVMGTISFAAPNAPTGESSLGDRVWHDLNNNGVQENGEPGINGVDITVYVDDGDGTYNPGTPGDQVEVETFSDGKTTTATNGTVTGYYNYGKVTADGNDFWVVIDSDNFGSGGALEGYLFSSELASAFAIEGEPGSATDPLRMYVPTAPGQFRVTIDTADFGFWKPDVSLSITPGSATNAVNDPHVFTIKVMENVNGTMVPKSGVKPVVSISGSPAPTSTTDVCAVVGTNSSGECTVTINSDTATVYTASASLSVDYGTGGTNGTVTVSRQTGTAANTAAGGTGNATKTYVDLRISIDPQEAFNAVGAEHIFTVLVEQKVGNGNWVPVPDGAKPVVAVTSSLTPNPASPVTADTCASPGTVSGKCTVTINSNIANVFTANASLTYAVESQPMTRNTLSTAGANYDRNQAALQGSGKTGEATKTYVDLRISIDPNAAFNAVGAEHIFTVLVEQKVGSGNWTSVPNGVKPVVAVTSSLTPVPATAVTANTCASPGTVSGKCTVTINSDIANVFTANASLTYAVESQPMTRNTLSTAGTDYDRNQTALQGSGKTGAATKTYVDLRISIGPLTATNPVQDPHTFTIKVEQKVGSGNWTSVPNGVTPVVAVTSSLTPVPATAVTANTCASTGTVGGECTVTINSNIANVFTANASVTYSVESQSMIRTTLSTAGTNYDRNIAAGGSTSAKKTYLAATLGDKVWWDIDKDGIQDSGEPGIKDVTVNLFVGSSTTVYSTTQTNSSGIYQFVNLPPNTYRIEIAPAEFTGSGTLVDWVGSPRNAGGNDELDSDAISGVIDNVALGLGATDNSNDFGFYVNTDYTISKTVNVSGAQRLGDVISFTIEIKNLGTSYLATIPLTDTFNIKFLEFVKAEVGGVSTPPNSDTTTGDWKELKWNDVNGAAQLAPNATFSIDVFFKAVGDTTDTNVDNVDRPDTVNYASVVSPTGDPDGPSGPLPPVEPLSTKGDDDKVQIINPTAVTIASSTMAVDPAKGTVTVNWQTVSEADIAGFNLMRRVDGGELEQVNSQFILAQNPGQPVGSWYSFTDSQASVGSNMTYLLQFITADGRVVNYELDTVFVGYRILLPLVIR